jgi:hypothetical protein
LQVILAKGMQYRNMQACHVNCSLVPYNIAICTTSMCPSGLDQLDWPLNMNDGAVNTPKAVGRYPAGLHDNKYLQHGIPLEPHNVN